MLMDSQLLIAVLLVTFMICVFLTWYFSHNARTKERLILIEKGVDPEVLFRKGQRFRFPWLKLGVLAIGIGVAFGIIAFLGSLDLGRIMNELAFATLAICTGISLVIANYLGKRNS